MSSRVRESLPALLLAALVGGTAAAHADAGGDPPPPFHLPASGVLFASDFRTGRADGWQPDRDEVWSVRNGALCASLPDRRQAHSFIYAGAEEWEDYAVDVDLCQVRGVDKGLVVRVQKTHGVGVDLRGAGYDDVLLHHDIWPLGQARVKNVAGVWHHLRVEARGNRYRVWVNGTLLMEKLDPHHSHARGHIALAAYTGGVGQCEVRYANVVVTKLQ